MSEMATLIPPGGLPSPTASKKTFGVEALNIIKRFGEFTALDQVSLKVRPGTFHALLGENGAGKSTLVKCIMGYYQADGGELMVDDRQQVINNPRARTLIWAAWSIGFHARAGHDGCGKFCAGARPCALGGRLGPRAQGAGRISGAHAVSCRSTPSFGDFRGRAAEVQILKQLYLQRRFLILDEPTSVLTPGEAGKCSVCCAAWSRPAISPF
jgi:simple sugar transport system ATP-binding protein